MATNNNKKTKVYKVKNRSMSSVVYKIPERNIRREFAPGEVKNITYSELESLSYQPGGRELMANFLQINEEDITNKLNIYPEAEYYMNEEQIKDLLLTGSVEALLDCLDFAPIGVIDLVKQYSIALPLRDTQKIAILKEKTGFDVAAALANMAADKETEDTTTPSAEAPKAAGRRTQANYKIVTPKE